MRTITYRFYARNKQSKEVDHYIVFSNYDYRDDMTPVLLKNGGNFIATEKEAKMLRDANLKRLNNVAERDELCINEWSNDSMNCRWSIAPVLNIKSFFDKFFENENEYELVVSRTDDYW